MKKKTKRNTKAISKKRKTSATTPRSKKRNTSATTPMSKKRKASATTLRSPPANKTKTNALTLTSLPDDLLLSCLARVSRLYYPTLSLVSKSFRSLLASPELYKARSLLGRTESCLYVCIWYDLKYRWFTLCRKPDENLTNDTSKNVKSSGYVLAKLLLPQFPHTEFSGRGLVAVGSSIYNLAEYGYSTSTSILDCRSHTWSEAAGLWKNLRNYSATVVDRKIYVAECYLDKETKSLKNSTRVFDTEIKAWDPDPIPCSVRNGNYDEGTACINGKFHLVTSSDKRVVSYHSKEGKWDVVEQRGIGMGYFMHDDSYCVIENVLYSASVSDGDFRWYDTEESEWRKLEGMVGLPTFPQGATVRLADQGGKMAVVWEETLVYDDGFSYERETIWCAEITLEKRKNCEIWGKVDWCDQVLNLPFCRLVKALAVTV